MIREGITPDAHRVSEVQVDQLRRVLAHWGVTTVGFDMDGTLKNTRSLFTAQFVDAAGYLLYGEEWLKEKALENGAMSRAEEYKSQIMDEVLWSLRPEVGINPIGGELMVHVAARQLGLRMDDPRIEKALECVRAVYRLSPVNYPLAVETVEMVNKAGVRTLLMTHAEEGWSQIKRRDGYTGLFERMVCFSIDRPKSGQWGGHLLDLGIHPEEFLVIGDDYRADIHEVVAMGGRGVWVSEHYKPFCIESGHHEELDNQRVIRVGKIGEVIPAMINGGG